MYRSVKNPAPSIGLVVWVPILVCLFILTTVDQAKADCAHEEIYYEFKMLEVAERYGIPIEISFAEYILFGDCSELGILSLESGRKLFLNLRIEKVCEVRIVPPYSRDPSSIQNVLSGPTFWNEMSNALSGFPVSMGSCELRAFSDQSRVVLLATEAGSDVAHILGADYNVKVPFFVTNRINEIRYLEFLMMAIEVEKLQGGSLHVAGDQGLVAISAEGRVFVEYPSEARVSICSHDTILERASRLPPGVVLSNTFVSEGGEDALLVAIANYFRRASITGAAFGCDQ